MGFQNTYEDACRAQAYDELHFDGTYRLVADTLPRLLSGHVRGSRALDFGCGTGRSTRFLQKLGFTTTGVDISGEMVRIARLNDPSGHYRISRDGDLGVPKEERYDLILCAFPFDNIPGYERKVRLFRELGGQLAEDGRLVNIVSTPEIYLNEWVTFTTKDFPENRDARSGDIVKIITKTYSDGRPVDDILWPDDDYRAVYAASGLVLIQSEAPIARGDEGIAWLSEASIPPWRIYVLGPER